MTTPYEFTRHVLTPKPELDNVTIELLKYNCAASDYAVTESGRRSFIDDAIRVWLMADPRPIREDNTDTPVFTVRWFTTNMTADPPDNKDVLKPLVYKDVTEEVKAQAIAYREEQAHTKEMEALLGMTDE